MTAVWDTPLTPLAFLRRSADVFSERTAIVYGDRRYSFAEFVDLANEKITLTGVDSLGNDLTLTTYTNDDGSYSFGDLPAGTYQLSQTQPRGYLDG